MIRPVTVEESYIEGLKAEIEDARAMNETLLTRLESLQEAYNTLRGSYSSMYLMP